MSFRRYQTTVRLDARDARYANEISTLYVTRVESKLHFVESTTSQSVGPEHKHTIEDIKDVVMTSPKESDVLQYTGEPPVSVTATTSGQITGTEATITIPPHKDDEVLFLVVSRSTTGVISFSSNVTATQIASGGGRLDVYRIEPQTQTEVSFTMTTTNSVISWAMLRVADMNTSLAPSYTFAELGNSTTSTIEAPILDLGYVTTGRESLITVYNTNSTAEWVTTPNTVYNTTSGGAAMMIESQTIDGGVTSPSQSANRGLDGQNRFESALVLLLPARTTIKNYVTNGGFEVGTTLAQNWINESTATGTIGFSVEANPALSGRKSQRVQYAGTATDVNKKIQFYQSNITGFSEDDVVTFKCTALGSMTHAYVAIGVEAFDQNGQYITDVTTNITEADGTEHAIEYTCPAGTSYIAAFVQILGVIDSTSVDLYFDNAHLYRNSDVVSDLKWRNASSPAPTLKQRTIAASTAQGVQGEICFDDDYLYVCVALNTWKRVALSSW